MIALHIHLLRVLSLSLLLVLGAGQAAAQVKITGEVTHNGEPLDQVVIRIYENGNYLRAIAADRKGRYEANLPYNHRYEFVFSKPFMIKVKILINTEVGKEISESQNSYEVPFNMVMHYRYEGMNLDPSDNAIGVIRHAGSGQESFQFFPEPAFLNAVKSMNMESVRLETSGAKPMEKPREAKASAAISQEPTAKPEGTEESIKSEEEAAMEEEALENMAMELEEQRQQTLQRATEMKSQNERRQLEKATSAQEQRGSEELESIYSAKVQRAESLKINRESQEKLMDMRVKADSLLNQRLIIAASNHRTTEPSSEAKLKPISREIESGWLYDDELLNVLENGQSVVYKHTTWDFGLFESNYYYRNEHEIDLSEYEKVRALFGE